VVLELYLDSQPCRRGPLRLACNLAMGAVVCHTFLVWGGGVRQCECHCLQNAVPYRPWTLVIFWSYHGPWAHRGKGNLPVRCKVEGVGENKAHWTDWFQGPEAAQLLPHYIACRFRFQNIYSQW